LRERISALDEHHWIQMLGDNPPDEDIPIVFNGHMKLGSPMQHPSLIIDIEKRNASDCAFQAFHRKLSEFINTTLPTYGHQLMSWLTFPADFQVCILELSCLMHCIDLVLSRFTNTAISRLTMSQRLTESK
jgi:hypothetical protein